MRENRRKNIKKNQKMTGFIFNIDGGYLEGLCRGFKCGILKQTDYLNLVQCETLEGELISYFFRDKNRKLSDLLLIL